MVNNELLFILHKHQSEITTRGKINSCTYDYNEACILNTLNPVNEFG